jgi:hypothetical protein
MACAFFVPSRPPHVKQYLLHFVRSLADHGFREQGSKMSREVLGQFASDIIISPFGKDAPRLIEACGYS